MTKKLTIVFLILTFGFLLSSWRAKEVWGVVNNCRAVCTVGSGDCIANGLICDRQPDENVGRCRNASCLNQVNCICPPPPPPNPTNLSASCPAPGTSATVSWSAVAGATGYALRVDDTSNGWQGDCNVAQFPGDICIDTLTTTSYTFTSTASHSFSWWVHAINAGGWSSGVNGPNFTCTVPTPTPTPTPIPTSTPTPTPTGTPTPTPTPTPIPATNYFSMQTAQSSNGVVSKGNTLSFGGNIGSKMSVPGWQVKSASENLTQPVYDYNYFYQKMGSPTTTNFTGKLNEIVAGTTVYYAGGATDVDNLMGGNWSNYNANAVIFVNGNLNINTQVLVPVGKFLAFIVSGNITIAPTIGTTADSTVSTVEGIYLANGTINTNAGNGVAHAKFVGRGMFIAGANLDGVNGFNLQRDLGANNSTYPGEYFEYRPDFLVNFPSQLGTRRLNWKEVAP